ncbi:RES domain-containing protein [Mycobacterium dioxanotrophicus]|uniref:RES domain-containing protein n=1 Tax=Mycobacterium dioxanotrophicus TaxID=482462 RepID=UPI002FCAB2CB
MEVSTIPSKCKTSRSGEGARRSGGRWNPPACSRIYLSDSAHARMRGGSRTGRARGVDDPEKMLEAQYRLHIIDATDLAVVDLTTAEARDAVGLDDDDIVDDD